jgi:hypothetical protein
LRGIPAAGLLEAAPCELKRLAHRTRSFWRECHIFLERNDSAHRSFPHRWDSVGPARASCMLRLLILRVRHENFTPPHGAAAAASSDPQ